MVNTKDDKSAASAVFSKPIRFHSAYISVGRGPSRSNGTVIASLPKTAGQRIISSKAYCSWQKLSG